MERQTLVIGDIHGCLNELKEMVSMVPEDTKIISCGDLIDRGPDSEKVVQYCIDNGVQVCLGNHELMAIEAMEHPAYSQEFNDSDWVLNGGREVYEDYSTKEVLDSHIAWFKSLPVAINTGHKIGDKPVIVSHTYILEMGPTENLFTSTYCKKIWPLVWNRDKPHRDSNQAYVNIHGHSPTDFYAKLNHAPYFTKSSINLDTGCAYDQQSRGYLTGILLPSQNIIQVKRKD